MATTPDVFRFPQFNKFIPYTAPSQKPKGSRQRALKEAESISHQWPNIDEMLENISEQTGGPDDTQAFTAMLDFTNPGRLDYLENEVECEKNTTQEEGQVEQLSMEGHLQPLFPNGAAARVDHSFTSDSPAPLVSDNHLNGGQELEDALEDAETGTHEPDHQVDTALSGADGQLHGKPASNVSLNRARHLPSLQVDIAMSQADVLVPKRRRSGTPELQNKRKRSSYPSAEELQHNQTPNLLHVRHTEDGYSSKRSKRHASTDHESPTSGTSHIDYISSRPRNDATLPAENDTEGTVNMSNSHMSGDKNHAINYNNAGATNTPTSRVSENDYTDSGYSDEPVKDADRDINRVTAATFQRRCDTPTDATQQRAQSMEQAISPPQLRTVRSNVEAELHRKRAIYTKCRSGDTGSSFLRKARQSVTVTTQSSRHGNESSPSSSIPQKLTHTTLRRVSTHMLFFATIVQDDRPVPVFSYGSSMTLIERALGNFGYIEGPAIIPLALNSWLVIGFLNELPDGSESVVDQEATQSNSIPTSMRRYYIPRRKATDKDNYLSTDEEQSSDDDSSSDADSSASEDVDSSEEGERPSIKSKKIRWSQSDDTRLQKYLMDDWKWSEIFTRFPDRTPGAVRLRGHMLRKKGERKSSQ